MTISQALISLNAFPIPASLIERVGIDRALTIADDYTIETSLSQPFRLAVADVYMWLYGQPTLGEQEVSFLQVQDIKKGFLKLANDIYLEYDDPKFTGNSFGFVGENYNG